MKELKQEPRGTSRIPLTKDSLTHLFGDPLLTVPLKHTSSKVLEEWQSASCHFSSVTLRELWNLSASAQSPHGKAQ